MSSFQRRVALSSTAGYTVYGCFLTSQFLSGAVLASWAKKKDNNEIKELFHKIHGKHSKHTPLSLAAHAIAGTAVRGQGACTAWQRGRKVAGDISAFIRAIKGDTGQTAHNRPGAVNMSTGETHSQVGRSQEKGQESLCFPR